MMRRPTCQFQLRLAPVQGPMNNFCRHFKTRRLGISYCPCLCQALAAICGCWFRSSFMLHVDPLSSFVVGTGKILDRHGPTWTGHANPGCSWMPGCCRIFQDVFYFFVPFCSEWWRWEMSKLFVVGRREILEQHGTAPYIFHEKILIWFHEKQWWAAIVAYFSLHGWWMMMVQQPFWLEILSTENFLDLIAKY